MEIVFKIYSYIKFKTRGILRGLKQNYYTWQIKKTAAKCGEGLKVNGKSVINHNTSLGNNVNFNGLVVTGLGNVVIGDNFHSGIGCRLITSFHNYEGNAIPYDSTIINKNIIIEDNVWLGDNVIVLGGITIKEGAIIQAGSVVVSDIPVCAIAGGHPARVFGNRNKERYFDLKEQKKFH